ncbi:MAG TPA: hypothetical protein PLQ11_00785 [Beijerinckiaceae bacterium]|nr:hypothetical protein [Beijerinckiaceae bacterium]
MKALFWSLGLLIGLPILALAGWIGVGWVYMRATEVDHRFRLTVEITTPDGVRSASSVINVNRTDIKWMPLSGIANRFNHTITGEAVFVDFGSGRHAIGLLAHGPRAEDSDTMITLWVQAYAGFMQRGNEDIWRGRRKLEGIVELAPELVPTIVTFTDLADPASAKVVYATGRDIRFVPDSPGSSSGAYGDFGPLVIDRFEETFGKGYALKRVTIEMTTDPITTGIEGKINWIGDYAKETTFERLLRGNAGGSSLMPGRNLKRS